MDPQLGETILPKECWINSIEWEFDEELNNSLPDPIPADCPINKKYVPPRLRNRLIVWAHTSPASGHPGTRRTLKLIQGKYWWESVAKEINDYVASCSICAQSKVPRHFPAGKLLPLENPRRPWLHLAIDFITDLPMSEGNTTILVTTDRFSHVVHLIPLPSLPSAFQTAELLFTHLFRYYGLPEDIVSDRGPQFIPRVWKAFMEKLGITVSLTSGFHAQSNGQVERLNQGNGRYLRTYCVNKQNDWARYVPWVEYAQNSLKHSATNLTPFQCVLGFQPSLFPWNPNVTGINAVDEWFTHSEQVWESAHQRL